MMKLGAAEGKKLEYSCDKDSKQILPANKAFVFFFLARSLIIILASRSSTFITAECHNADK